MDNLAADFIINLNNPIEAEFELGETEHFDCSFELFAAGTVWGSIDGDISNQTDLKNALDSKADITTVNELSGDLSNLTTTVNNNYTELDGRITQNHNDITSLSQTLQSYGDIVTYDAADFATAAQGVLANTALQPGDNISELVNNAGYITSADLPTLEDLTTQAQMNAINSGATTVNIAQIASNTQAISTETLNRQNADNGLQSQIDAIVASSDVFDIVGTYAELQAYDISTVPPNDIIKVLVDSTHNNAATYYRCIETNSVKSWSYIGSEGAYYTKSEADGRFVPQTRTINGKDLSNNISLDASDVGALPSSTVIPTVNNGTLDIQVNGTSVGTFTANQSGNTTANIVVPDSATWGNITGDIEDQTDLQNALDDKQDKLTAGTDLEIVEGVQLPEGYTPLEYIQFTGTQYINTGIWGNAGLETDVTFSFDEVPSDNSVLASRVGGTRIYPIHIFQGWCIGYGNYYPTYNVPSIDTVYNVVTVLEAGQQTMKVNNYGVVSRTDSTVYDTNIPLYLGAQSNASSADGTITARGFVKIKVYRIKIKSNGVLVFDGVPCKRGDIVGLYNTITDEFLLNSGTGSLIAGDELPSALTINFTNETGYITGIDSNDVTTALGYTPVNPSSLATVATSGSYDDLTDKPYIPSGVIVDQTYDPTSQNAQSGVAINGAGYATQSWVDEQGYITGISSSDVTTALGYTPYNSSNPNGYTSNVGTVTSVNNVQPVNGNVTLSIPSVGNGTVTFTQGGVTKGSITMNQSGNTTIDFDAGGSGGIQNTATGTDSLTILGTPASDDNSINIGVGSRTSDDGSIAIGAGNTNNQFNGAIAIERAIAIGSGYDGYNGASADGYSVAIGTETEAIGGAIAVGSSAKATAAGGQSIAIGYVATASGASSIALGDNSEATATSAIQIGSGTNNNANTLQVGSRQLLDITTGLIPDARLSSNIARTTDIPIVPEEVFIAEYGRTTYQDVLDAYNAGKAIYAKRQVTSGASEIFSLCSKQPNTFWFANPGGINQQGMFILPQSTVYTLDAQNTWDIGTFTNASNTLSNVVAIDSSSAVQTALDGKVSKSGDTMSGNLELQSDEIERSVIPSENLYTPYLNFTDKNGDNLANIYFRQSTDGSKRLQIACRDNSNIGDSLLTLGYHANGNAYCVFPNTTCCDGQWVNSYSSVISDTSLTASTNLNKTVTLPNDGSIYMVTFRAILTSGNATGNYIRLSIKSNVIDNPVYVCAAATRANATITQIGWLTIPVKYDTNNITITRASGYTGTATLEMLGYRRVGTNT